MAPVLSVLALAVGAQAQVALPPKALATSLDPGPVVTSVLTVGDGGQRLAAQPAVSFTDDSAEDSADDSAVTVYPGQRHQTVVGFGAALTESAAAVLDQLPPERRTQALTRLFDPDDGAGVSVVRVPLGASDFALGDYTYDDLPAGETDRGLRHFSIERDLRHIIPLLLDARRINRDLTVVLSAWSAPAWMKTSQTTHGGRLKENYEGVYARYLARAAAAYVAAGVQVRAMTLVNEPGHETSAYPSMAMWAGQQGRVAEALRRHLDEAGLGSVQLLAYDHNWDNVAFPVTALTGAHSAAFTGAAFHCYAGDVSAQATVKAAAPGAQLWTTECSGGDWSASFDQDLRWGARHMLIGALRNYSVASLWWNLALNPAGGPTNGGCQGCRGVVTVDPAAGTVEANVEYWLLSHVGRYVPRGSVRLATTPRTAAGIESVAFATPAGRTVLLLLNDSAAAQPVTVRWQGRSVRLDAAAGAVVTAVW